MKAVYALIIIAAVSLIGACSTKQPLPSAEQRDEARRSMPCIVVLPVTTEVNGEPGISYERAAELDKAAEFMDSVMSEELVGHDNVRTLSARQLTSLLPADSASQQALLTKVGEVTRCNGIMTTTLSRFRQRVGGSYGAESPAAVTFTMKLYDVQQGAVVWSGMFSEVQQSVLSNLITLGASSSRGFTWLTAEELLSYGIKEKIKECPYF